MSSLEKTIGFFAVFWCRRGRSSSSFVAGLRFVFFGGPCLLMAVTRVVTALLLAASAASAWSEGDACPSFSLTDENTGSTMTEDDLLGTPTVVAVFAAT